MKTNKEKFEVVLGRYVYYFSEFIKRPRDEKIEAKLYFYHKLVHSFIANPNKNY